MTMRDAVDGVRRGIKTERQRCLEIVEASRPDLSGMSGMEVQQMNGGDYMDNLKAVITKKIRSGESA